MDYRDEDDYLDEEIICPCCYYGAPDFCEDCYYPLEECICYNG